MKTWFRIIRFCDTSYPQAGLWWSFTEHNKDALGTQCILVAEEGLSFRVEFKLSDTRPEA